MGQQIAIAVFTASVGLAAVVFIFRFRSFKEVIFAGRASRDAEREADRARHPELEDASLDEAASAPLGDPAGSPRR